MTTKRSVPKNRGSSMDTRGQNTDIEATNSFPHVPFHSPHMDPEKEEAPSDLRGDRCNVALLIFLYVLQGIPLGLSASIPFLLQSKNVSYQDQAIFSFVYWPFSVKLFWAPIVDALYLRRFGRRKSWLVPTQYLIGVFMLMLSTQAGWLLGDARSAPASILMLTAIFFMLNFLAATQDIVVDGWALTMLSRPNVGWASTCNSIGQTAGYFLGNVVFLALESPDFCNRYLRTIPQSEGIVTLSSFLYYWGLIFIITTTLVMLMKKEVDRTRVDNDDDDLSEQSIVETYCCLWKIVRLPAVTSLVVVLLTAKIGFAAADAITGLKLIEEGVPREKLALLGVPMVPVQIILPLIISRYTAGPRPLNVFMKAIPYRLAMGLVFAVIVWWTPNVKTSEVDFPIYYYVVILIAYALHQVTLFSMFVAQMAFYAKVSDPSVGGTYMTLLNTLSNLGGNWPSTVVLWFVESLTWKSCANDKCVTVVDGYYVESVICFGIGVAWLLWQSRNMRQLQDLPRAAWSIK